MKNNYFAWGVVIILILGIILFNSIPVISNPNDISLVLSFVGILATFIVVGNYLQVKEVEKKFDEAVLKQNKAVYQEIYSKMKDLNIVIEYLQNTTKEKNSNNNLEIMNISRVLMEVNKSLGRDEYNKEEILLPEILSVTNSKLLYLEKFIGDNEFELKDSWMVILNNYIEQCTEITVREQSRLSEKFDIYNKQKEEYKQIITSIDEYTDSFRNIIKDYLPSP